MARRNAYRFTIKHAGTLTMVDTRPSPVSTLLGMIVVILLGGLSGQAYGVSADAIAADRPLAVKMLACATEADADRRLACFDRLLDDLVETLTDDGFRDDRTTPVGSAGWYLEAWPWYIGPGEYVGIERIRWANTDVFHSGILRIACNTAHSNLFVLMDRRHRLEPLPAASPVRYRVDDGPDIPMDWRYSYETHILGPEAGGAEAFIRTLLAGSTLTITYEREDDGAPITFRFPLDGLAEVLQPVAAACDWTP